MPDARNVFISYARKDGADEAERLYNDLSKHGVAAWRDTHNLNPYEDFSGEIEEAIIAATHVVVCVTPDIRRVDSFVRREIAFALEENKPIIPLIFPGGRRPITIINHTYLDFTDWNKGFAALLERLKNTNVEEITPQTRRERELVYLQEIGQRYDHWRDLYTDLAATAHIEQPKVKLKHGAAARYLEMQHDIFKTISHAQEEDKSKVISVQSFDELREGIRQYNRVALIGDPGAGKTTTLERLAYELASEAAYHENQPLPLFVRLGAYDGGDFDTFLGQSLGGLSLHDYLPKRIFILLDGLNEMQPEHSSQVDSWLHVHPNVSVVVTCRKLDYIGHKLPLQRVDVAPLDVERIYLFIGNYLEDDDRDELFWTLSGPKTMRAWKWFRETQTNPTFQRFWFGDEHEQHAEVEQSAVKPSRTIQYRAQGEAWQPDAQHLRTTRRLLRTQNALSGMLDVMTNPFLLFATINIYTREGEPPSNRGQLFERFVDLLFYQQKNISEHLQSVEKSVQIQFLSMLAYQMQFNRTGTSVDISWVRSISQNIMPEVEVDQLLYLGVSAGILESRATVRFTHQLLQEYFAAYCLREAIKDGVPATSFWPNENWWEQTGWEETVILLAGIEGDATHVVGWLTPVQPTLAYRCVTESGAQCAKEALQLLYEPSEGERKSPLALAEWGRILAERDDTRPGVGLRPDRTPEITWIEIPEGDFIYQRNQQLFLPTFYISRHPITYRQYKAFLDAEDGYFEATWWDGLSSTTPGEQAFKYDNHPCENVSWMDAIAFCRWLSTKLGFEVRLPTEHEWEKAARGTDGRIYPWGQRYIPGSANIDEITTGVGPYRIGQTTAVGMYQHGASPYGVMDMGGNVWEWCQNSFDGRTKKNVVRGGSWSSYEHRTRTSYRLDLSAEERRNNVGFRVVCSTYVLLPPRSVVDDHRSE